jgi:hypothetical protein
LNERWSWRRKTFIDVNEARAGTTEEHKEEER